MTCLDNLIGIRGLCAEGEAPLSGLYIQDLTALTVINADAAIDEARQSGIDLIEEKINLAVEHVRNELISFYSAKIRGTSLLEQETIGYWQENLPTVAAEAGLYKGIHLRVDNYPYAELFVSSLRLQVQATGNVNVKVFDLITGKEIETITVACTADEITEVSINRTYAPRNRRIHLFFGYDSTTVAAYKTNIHESLRNCCGGMGAFRVSYGYFNGASLATSGTKIDSNVKGIGHTAGLSITYSLNCSPDPLICGMAKLMGWPVLHKAGALLMKEMQYSKRLNSVITLHTKEHGELADFYETEYMAAMDRLLKGIRVPKDVCFECREAVRYSTIVP